MSDCGKRLEDTIGSIERVILPDGFDVEIRHDIRDDSGRRIAEFDVFITGKVGASPFRMLIECRDRPSKGKAPASWIEQLFGRKARFEFDRIVAVSTTGFTNDARKFAEQANIELRELSRVSTDEILGLLRALVITRRAIPRAADVIPYGVADFYENKEEFEKVVSAAELDTAFLSLEGQPISILDIWKEVVDSHPNLFDGLEPNFKKVSRTVCVVFEHLDSAKYKISDGTDDLGRDELVFISYDVAAGSMVVTLSNKKIGVRGIIFRGELSIHRQVVDPTLVEYYERDKDEGIALAVTFAGDEDVSSEKEDVFLLLSKEYQPDYSPIRLSKRDKGAS